jgi:hypothetical protein
MQPREAVRQNHGLFLNRFRCLKHRHFESACLKETRTPRKVASGACHGEANNGIRRRHQAPRTGVYTQVYTGVENSGLLGPHASERSQLKPRQLERFVRFVHIRPFESTTAQTFCERDALPTELYAHFQTEKLVDNDASGATVIWSRTNHDRAWANHDRSRANHDRSRANHTPNSSKHVQSANTGKRNCKELGSNKHGGFHQNLIKSG